MYYFLIPLFIGFLCNIASAFTTKFSKWRGPKYGSLITVVLRNILGIPVWAIGFVIAARGPSPPLIENGIWHITVGWILLIIGAIIITIALVTIRIRAARPLLSDKIARTGIYAHVRHPIHTGTMFEFAGILFIFPTVAVAIACGLGFLWILLQTKCEEYDLIQRLPEYRDYMEKVPRFFPGLNYGEGRGNIEH